MNCIAQLTLKQKEADKTFYLGYDLNAVDNPHYHDTDLYPFHDAKGGNQLRTPQINNVTLLVIKSYLLINLWKSTVAFEFSSPRLPCSPKNPRLIRANFAKTKTSARAGKIA